MTRVALVLSFGVVAALTAWAIARGLELPAWGALTAAGTALIATSTLGMTILHYLFPVERPTGSTPRQENP